MRTVGCLFLLAGIGTIGTILALSAWQVNLGKVSVQPGAATPPDRNAPLGGCNILPNNNIWNTPIDMLPVDAAKTSTFVNAMGAGKALKADFGAGLWDGGPIGIPYVVVPQNQPRVTVNFDEPDESDPGPYPIPANAPIEGGPNADGDRHVLVITQGECKLYETYSSYPQGNGSWNAFSGAVFDLNSNALRPDTWTSADAAGLPILPGLVRYDEILAGEIKHAIRFTVRCTNGTHIWPARHKTSSSCTTMPPMGQYFRLRADFNISGFSPTNQIILKALKKYGMIVADNGSDWYMSGVPDERWNNEDLQRLGGIKGASFEAVDATVLRLDPNSGQVAPPPTPTGLVATPVGINQINLSWTDNSNRETEFYVERKTGAGGAYSRIATLGINATTLADTNLAEGTTYFYRVQAATGGAVSVYSNEANATTTLRSPTNLGAAVASSSRINLTWVDNSGTETYFELQRGGTPNFGAPIVVNIPANQISYVSADLKLATTYYYRIRACNTFTCSAFLPATGGIEATTLGANRLEFAPQPAHSEPGLVFATQPKVRILDINSNVVTNFVGTVSLELKAGTGNPTAVLQPSANLTTTVTNGVASFSGLSINKIGGSYRLKATANGNPVTTPALDSQAFDIRGKLVFLSQPPNRIEANGALTSTVTLQVQRISDSAIVNNYDGVINLGLSGGDAGAILSLNNTISPVTRNANGTNGSVSFSDELTIDRLGHNYRLKATSSDPLISAESNLLDVVGKLVISTPAPQNPPLANGSFSVTVTLQGANNSTLTYYNQLINLTLSPNPTNAYFYGTHLVAANNGVASFKNLAISKEGTGYGLVANVTDLAIGVLTLDVGAAGNCDGLLVNSTSDNAGADTFPAACTTITLRGALGRAAAGQVIRLDRNVFNNQILALTVLNNALPTLPAGVAIDGGCINGVPGLQISTGNQFGFEVLLSGGNELRGLELKGLANGLHLKAQNGANLTSCLKVGS